jgi:trigger factor
MNLDQLKETRNLIQVDEAILNETIGNLKSQFGEMVDAEEIAEADDFLLGELKELNGEFVKDQANFPLSRIKESERKKFTGKKKGDKITFEIQETFEDAAAIAVATGLTRPEAESKTGNFEFTVSNVRRKKLAEVNQELYDRVFGKDAVKTEEEFKEKLKTTIQENYSKETEALINRDIEQKLIKNTEITLPSDFLKDWLFKSNNGKFSKDEIENQFERFSEDLKWNLIKNKIAEENSIKAEHNEILAKSKEYILQQFGNLPLTEEMDETLNKIADNYLKQDNGKAYMQTYESVLAEKTLEFIKTKIKIDEKSVSLDEFKKLAGFSE